MSKRKKFLVPCILCALAAILMVKLFTSIDTLTQAHEQIKINGHLRAFKLSKAKIDYHVVIRKSARSYDYISFAGAVPSSVKARLGQLKTVPDRLSLNLYTPKNLIYTGTKSTRITLYVRNQSDLKTIFLNGKRISSRTKSIDMPGAGG
ncbi:hypothetical protein [Sporolactobacillus terrae]|uniref:hypothetical protein n=1 Tax=Sporolactobacillus terrae TaxID=269673 RepID=UPI00048F88BD|nr:hypothetical protein [Sporolactobacillus terrae]